MTHKSQPRYVATHFWDELKRQGRSIRWLSHQTGVHETTISLMKAGRRPIPESFVLSACRAIDVNPSLFFMPASLRNASNTDAKRIAALAEVAD